MAKRRRLNPADPDAPFTYLSTRPLPSEGAAIRRAPIAEVAGESAAHAALDALSSEMHEARSKGRLIEALPLIRIDPDHLIRDRVAVDTEEMEALVGSLRARGQRTPIEVVATPDGRYGLIFGWRRLKAIERLYEETGEDRFSTIDALIRKPESAADAYLGMVEENEIRSGVSFYERARLAAEAARIGVHRDVPQAIARLYAAASASKRSKIASFVTIHERLGTCLQFGPAIPERLGLALSQALQADDGFGIRLADALRHRNASDATEERDTLERALRKPSNSVPNAPSRNKAIRRSGTEEEVRPGLFLNVQSGRAVLSGPSLDDAAISDLRNWLARDS